MKITPETSYFGAILLEAQARAHRHQLILNADDRCQGRTRFGKVCGWLAYTRARQDQLALRSKKALDGTPTEGHWVLCPTCTKAYDDRETTQQRKAS